MASNLETSQTDDFVVAVVVVVVVAVVGFPEINTRLKSRQCPLSIHVSFFIVPSRLQNPGSGRRRNYAHSIPDFRLR